MSIKIFNGYRVTGIGGARPDVFELVTHLRTLLEPIYRAAYVETLTTGTVTLLDRDHIDQLDAESEPPGESVARTDKFPIFVVHREIEAAHRQANHDGLRAPDMDFQCDVALVPDPTDPAGPVYALVYTERDDYRAAWEQIPGVESYAYWNNSDRPRGVSAREWEERKEAWDRVLDRKAPADRGVTWRLLGDYLPLNPRNVRDDLAAAMPKKAARARAVARYRVPAVSIVDGQQIVWRDLKDVRADVAAETTRVKPLLENLSVDDLYASRALPAA